MTRYLPTGSERKLESLSTSSFPANGLCRSSSIASLTWGFISGVSFLAASLASGRYLVLNLFIHPKPLRGYKTFLPFVVFLRAPEPSWFLYHLRYLLFPSALQSAQCLSKFPPEHRFLL